MNTLRRDAVVMMAGFLAGAISQAAPGAPLAADVERKPAVQGAVGATPQVEVSARYVRVTGAMPEAKGALAFLADEAGLKAGTVMLTKAQAEAAVAKLVELTKREAGSTPRVTVLAGNPAKMGIGDLASVKESKEAPLEIFGKEVVSRPDVAVSLSVFPQVSADRVMQIKAEIEVTTLERFEKYMKSVEVKEGAEVRLAEVPSEFYHPIFSTRTIRATVRIAEGETAVVRTERKGLGGEQPDAPATLEGASETLIVFLTAKIVPVNDAGAARSRERMRLEMEAWKARQAK